MRKRSHEGRVGGVEERYTLTDTLAIATYLNGFIRHCDVVRIANFAQLVNVIAAICTNRQGTRRAAPSRWPWSTARTTATWPPRWTSRAGRSPGG